MVDNTNTPYYEVIEELRHIRQDLIRGIESITGRRLIVYFTKVTSTSMITLDDDVPRMELLNDDIKGADIDLMIQSLGGMISSAEKWIEVLQKHSNSFRVIVTGIAKSAATMIALGAESIIMGPNSELGPLCLLYTSDAADE